MKVQKQWNKLEAAILLDNYLKYLDNRISRKEAIEITSVELRSMAMMQHASIDDIYRNENGITFQMHSIESAYRGYTIIKPASKLFVEIVTMYRNDINEYERILKEARRMIEKSNSNKDTFFSWLSKEVSPAQLSELYITYQKFDEFCNKYRFYKGSLFDVTDLEKIKRIQRYVETNKIFKFQFKRAMLKVNTAMRYYAIYATEHFKIVELKNEKERTTVVDTTMVEENVVKETTAFQCEKKELPEVSANETVFLRSRNKSTIVAEDFYEWLSEKQDLAESTCRSYVSAVNCAESFARDNNLINQQLYTTDLNQVQATISELFNNSSFVEMDNKQHHRFKAGLNKLLQYLGGEMVNTAGPIVTFDVEPFEEILVEKFSRGYRLCSPLELRKFKRYWEEIYGRTPQWSDDELSKGISLCGIVHEDKVYMPQIMLDENTRIKLFSHINKSFQSGKNVIYYEALFKEFSDDFLECCMYNANMLKTYLAYMNDNMYFVGKEFISKDVNVKVSAYDEVKQCLEQNAIPMKCEEIFEILSHIPQQKIRNIIAQNREFISNGKGEYFHIIAFNISDDELEDISTIILAAILEKQFISGNELIDSIKKKHPYIIEQNTLLSDKGLRDAIGYKLSDKFSFKGNIISRKGQALSMMEVFSDFCKQRSSFSLDELKILKQELDTVIYFEAVYANSLRISKDQFVSKSNAAFLPAETDEAIDRFCFGDYIPLGKITHFGSFPDAGFQWNSFLLEHYVAMYSPSYKLVHSNYNEGVCVGAIVKKVSDIDTIDELIVDVLAKNGLPLQKEKSLQYLCDEGYLGRRSYAGIEQLLIKAKELRNQKGL